MRRRDGFSLLDLLVAFDILAVALFFMIGLIPFDNASVKQDAHILVASNLGRELLQNISQNFYNDGTDDSGAPLGASGTGTQWDGFAKSLNGSTSNPAIYCLSTTCPTGTTTDPTDTARPANTLFPPYPYAPICSTCTSISNYGSVLISTTSNGIPDSRQYYFYVDVEPINNDPALRSVKVVVFWSEQDLPGMTSGPNSWQQAGYRNVTLSTVLARASGP